jgi:GGDEF domain-containing protein
MVYNINIRDNRDNRDNGDNGDNRDNGDNGDNGDNAASIRAGTGACPYRQWREEDTVDTLFKRADNALFAAKKKGRNSVMSE